MSGRTRFVHVITADTDAVEFGHIPTGVRKNIPNDAHTWSRRIDIGITHHKLLQNVVLNGTC